MPDVPAPFNPNTPSDTEVGFPVIEHVYDIESYAHAFMSIGPTVMERWASSQADEIRTRQELIKSPTALTKAINLPPEMQSFARITVMPETHNAGVIECPGIPPEALRKIARECLAPQTIIAMRTDDVLRYAGRSIHPWKPGWRIVMRKGFDVPDEELKKDIEEACHFIENCNIETRNARERDKLRLSDFPTFLAELTRDSLTYDGMAVWTDIDLRGRVKAFKAMSSFNIRLTNPATGYNGDKEIFAVGVDEAGNVVTQFTRDELVFRKRNSRPDADIWGYGYPEAEQAVRLIQGFQNAFDMNADVFTRNSMPNGFLTVKGIGNQKQLDILSRIWMNLKRGISKSWAIPVIPLPKDGEIEIKDLGHLKDMDAYYQEYINMVAGLFCAIYRFPTHRLGYRTTGKVAESRPQESPAATPGIEDYDPYISVLLQHHEQLINPYILWTRWPHLEFQFTGKSPKEDAREYEARILACTVDERRALSDLPKLEEMTEGGDEEEKKINRMMGCAPVDPALAGVYQALVVAALAPKPTEGAGPEARMSSKKDPAKSEAHGHMSGVRRDSAKESSSKE